VAEVFIDSRNLVKILREIEQPFAEAEGDSESAGQYDGLPAILVFYPSKYYLGEPPKKFGEGEYPSGKLPVLGCNCGEMDCNPFLAHISVSETTITCSKFENLYYPTWTYEQLGRLVFEKTQYESALKSHVPVKFEKQSLWRRIRNRRTKPSI